MVCSQSPHQVSAKHQENYLSNEDGCCIENEKGSGSAGTGWRGAKAISEAIWRGDQCDSDVLRPPTAMQHPIRCQQSACSLCADIPVRKTVNVPVATDKGMCGGINTNIAKLTNACTVIDASGMPYIPCRRHLRNFSPACVAACCYLMFTDVADTEKETRVMCVGSKGVNPMKRLQGGRLDGALTDYTKNKITFAMV